MLDDRYARAEQDRMHGSFPAISVVDVERVDPDEDRALIPQEDRRAFREVRVAFEILVGPPMPVPAGMDQHCPAAHIRGGEHAPVDCPSDRPSAADHDGGAPGHRLEWQTSQVMTVREPVVRRVQVRTGISDHLDAVDLELRSRSIRGARRPPRQMIVCRAVTNQATGAPAQC